MSPRVIGTAEPRFGRLLAMGIAAAVLLSSPDRGATAERFPGATVEELLARVRTVNPEVAAAALEREAAVASHSRKP